MLRTALITYLLAIIPTATCKPGIWCLNPRDGDKLASRYADLIGAFTPAKACEVLTPDFAATSDSINAISGIPSGNVTYDSRDAFVAAQPCWPAVAMDVAAVVAVSCDTVVLRWTQRWADDPAEISGISVLVAIAEDDDWKIRRVWEEFNGLAVLESLKDVLGMWTCKASSSS
ncbi:hypothetical protein F4803DRAFT_512850 [Xylaria telfairii]|nr:hypothetical protein F4803DRAFT_512850 [Xylaria telfairii]